MSYVIFCRHGDTFEAGQPAVWIGSKNDLPLSQNGRKQAEKLANAIASASMPIAKVSCAPLKRTAEYATIMCGLLKLGAPLPDESLMELDYGGWGGLTSNQVVQRFGENMLRAWDEQSIYPPEGVWGETEDAVVKRLQRFLKDFSSEPFEGLRIAVTSNGVLRLMRKHLILRDSSGCTGNKVRTGNACVIEFVDGRFLERAWNVGPQELADFLKGA